MEHYKITFDTWNKVARLYQDRFMDIHLYDDSYDSFCRLVKTGHARVFEIGCGPGNVTKYLLSKRPDLQIEAIDIAPAMVQLAQANNPAATFRVMDCRDIDQLHATFDAIICGFCLPYLSKADVAKLIKDCSALLPAGGIAYFSAIEGDYNKSGFEASSTGDKMYVYYHQEDYLRQVLLTSNFEVIDLQRIEYLRGGNPEIHMIFIVRKK